MIATVCPVLTWLQVIVPASLPDQVVAFALNMTESEDWKVELVGCATYDAQDDDWACPPEAWSGSDALELGAVLGGESWETAQAYVIKAVAAFIEQRNCHCAQTFRSAQAVCVGFVDGDLVRVWPDRGRS